MLIKSPKPLHARESEVTDRDTWLSRRRFLGKAARGAGLALAASSGGAGALLAGCEPAAVTARDGAGQLHLGDIKANKRYLLPDTITEKAAATTYNNFYEMGVLKSDPRENAHLLKTTPWSVRVHGMVDKPADYQLEDFIAPHQLEERIYRLRCVEAWSMVIPWVGFPMADLIGRAQPTSKARFVKFTTLLDPAMLPGQRTPVLDWPYIEALELKEALHPLTLLSVGMYGEVLPNQNGAPLRLVVPWKYGYKSIKSIVDIEFTDRRPVPSWTRAAPNEYPFYSNVNPSVNHPRWSQARERRITNIPRGLDAIGALLEPKIETLMFNGYPEVAELYRGMDMTRLS